LKYQWLILRVLASAEPLQFDSNDTFVDIYTRLSNNRFESFSPVIADILVGIFEEACDLHLGESTFQYWGLGSPSWNAAFSKYMEALDDKVRSTIQSERVKSNKYSPEELAIWEKVEGNYAFVKQELTTDYSLPIPPMLGGLPFLCPSSIARMLDVLLRVDPLCTLVSFPSTSLVGIRPLTKSAGLHLHCPRYNCIQGDKEGYQNHQRVPFPLTALCYQPGILAWLQVRLCLANHRSCRHGHQVHQRLLSDFA
jgi:hypothetical protein